jgi:two-component system chemotaxis sensor kinase CheA
VRVDLAEMDTLLASIAEASSHITGLRHELALLGHTRRLAQALAVQLAAARDGGGEVAGGGHRPRALVEELRGSLERLDRLIPMVVDRAERDLTQVREQADRVRLLPASTLFAGLERAVRDAAQTLGKQVHFHATGGELRLDGHVLAGLNEALLHVVRNAVAHGIEPEPQRRAAGKPPAGRVTVEVTVRGRAVHITCSDDGGGLDLPGIRRAAIARGALPPDAPPLDHKRAVTMLLGGGLTTRAHVDDVAGRAVGLDVLREVAARLNGHVDIRSQPGRGTTVELAVARSLHAQTVLLVQTGGAVVSLPLRAIETTLRVPAAELVRAGDTECIGFRDHLIPFAPLGRVLGREGGSGAGTGRGNGVRRGPRTWSALVVRAPGGALVALGVDGLLGTANVVAWPVPELAAADPVVAAASLDAQGNPQLVLDPAQLAARARASAADIIEEAPPVHRDPVLIIDDSLTTRMLEQSILESAGYTVELATSAEEGMTLARQRPYSLFLVDVEMPGMNGFEFVERTRADPVLGKIPAILVTSLAAPEHLRRGKEAGAAGHVAKGEFDQGALLQSIKELVG